MIKLILSIILPSMFIGAHIAILSVPLPGVREWYIFYPLAILSSLFIYNTFKWVYGSELIITTKVIPMTKEEWEKERSNVQ